jgi:hypothetical protein
MAFPVVDLSRQKHLRALQDTEAAGAVGAGPTVSGYVVTSSQIAVAMLAARNRLMSRSTGIE